ncbi:MAG: Yip1 family protein [Gemmatimonadaceae bacterium]
MTAPDSATASDTTPAPVTKSASLWEDFIDIFISPSEVFERRRNSGFFVPLLVFAVLMTVLAIIGMPALQAVFDAEFSRQMAATMKHNPGATAEQMAKGRAIAEKFQAVFVFFSALIAPLIVGVVLWIVGKFVDAKEDIKAACMIATYVFFPRIIEFLVNIAQGFLLDPASLNGHTRLSLGVGRFFDPDTVSPVLLAVVGRIDLFTIWVTVLLAIGLSVVARIPRSRAAIAAVTVWVIGMIPAVLQALRAS